MRTLVTALLMSTLLPACGDDGASSPDSTLPEVDVPTVEVDVPDTTSEVDTTVPDVTADTSVDTTGDTATDSTVADTNDTTISDTTADTIADTTDTSTTDTTVADTSTTDTIKPNCIELPASHTRHIVLSRPYTEEGLASLTWEVYPLRADATLGPRTTTFELGAAGRAVGGKVAFSEDGALAMAAHDRGEVSVFAVTADGEVVVTQPATDLGPYVGAIEIHGDDVFLVDGNWQNNGGGIYHTRLACDGTLGPVSLLYATKNAYGVKVRGGLGALEHLVMAREAVDDTSGYVHRIAQAGPNWTRLGGVNVFGDDDGITSAMVVTPDWRYVLVADNSEFSGVPNRIGVATIDPMANRQLLSPLDDPYDMVMSPYGNAVLVVLGYANRVTVLSYDAQNTTTPFAVRGMPTFTTQVPQLPSDAVALYGDHDDIVYVVENTALRVFRFEANGTVTDLGRQIEGSGLTSIPGAIGAQP